MYNLFTQWITLSVIFFLANYACNFIEVVTLGGLVAGSFMIEIGRASCRERVSWQV